MIPAKKLRTLRNRISIDQACLELEVPTKYSEGYLRFLCPLCSEFNTATNSRTNLGRCFGCARNFNPIDLAMVVGRMSFLEAVDRLDELIED